MTTVWAKWTPTGQNVWKVGKTFLEVGKKTFIHHLNLPDVVMLSLSLRGLWTKLEIEWVNLECMHLSLYFGDNCASNPAKQIKRAAGLLSILWKVGEHYNRHVLFMIYTDCSWSCFWPGPDDVVHFDMMIFSLIKTNLLWSIIVGGGMNTLSGSQRACEQYIEWQRPGSLKGLCVAALRACEL